MKHVRVAIIGGGPAGLSAAIYAARANLSPLVFVGMEHSSQLFTTTEVENFPSHKSILGPNLIQNMSEQAEHCGAELLYEDVKFVDLSKRPFRISHGYGDDVTEADSLIIATGSTARRLHPTGEEKYWQKGVSACAVCDSMMAKDQECIVVGGGDVACEEATYISKIAKKVYMVLRRDQFRASAAMSDRVKRNPNIEIIYDSAIDEIKGDDKTATSVVIRNLKTGEKRELPTRALYWAVGHDPQTKFLNPEQIDLDESGYVKLVQHPYQRTSVEGVFAAGDCCDKIYRQAVYAAGSGCAAALDAERWLASKE
ncbi:Thioredoxin reductase [Giardia muris]|uniref:Thioredoxin reductase n=1 Tax=Giardia muris TaxID=5742 RepID=A0A3S5GR55_GIAMU|nr:Thioredoxin reductase [Giardia muris]TNJ28107.1 Thioredoxin reductase [Giardia muris]|eukprot:TNJ28107.1 Thioredoxin reductase [Giardia muris]